MTHYDSLLQIKFVTSVQRTACAVLLDKFHTFLNSRLNEERTPAFSDHWNIKKNVICRIKAQKKICIFTKCETSSCSVLRANTMIIPEEQKRKYIYRYCFYDKE